MQRIKYHTVGTFPTSYSKIVESGTIVCLAHKYMTIQFPGLVQALQVAHRLPKRRDGRPRSIIAKFEHRKDSDRV